MIYATIFTKGQKLYSLAGATLLFSLLLSEPVSAENYFRWNADSMKMEVMGQESECTSLKGSTIIDTSEKHSGSGSIRHTLSGSQRDEGCDGAKQSPGGDVFDGGETYMRWWMKIDPAIKWGNQSRKTKIARINRSNEELPGYATINMHAEKIIWEVSFTKDGRNLNYYLDTDFDPSDGSCHSTATQDNIGAECTEWREYVLYFRRNTCPNCSNGEFALYVNGTLADQETSITFADFVPADGETGFKYTWAGVMGKIFPQICANGDDGCGSGGRIWVDDISIDSTWNSIQWPMPSSGPKPLAPAPIRPAGSSN